jgi:hypothetical protein
MIRQRRQGTAFEAASPLAAVLRALALTLASCLFWVQPGMAASEILNKGIKAFNSGHYQKAIGLLGQAETSEFNNPVLHYYLANALSKVNQKPDAIKEYKIAMALQPEGQMSQYCTAALEALGALPKSGKEAGKGNEQSSGPTTAEILSAAIDAINKDADEQVAKEKQRVGEEILRLKFEPIDAGLGLSSSPFGGNFRYSSGEMNAQQRISKLTLELERKTFEIKSAARAKIGELKAASAGKTGSGLPSRTNGNVLRAEAVYNEAQARIIDEERRVDVEIRKLQAELGLQMMENPRNHQTVRSEVQKKIERLREDLERRKAEINADAKARADALDPEYGKPSSPGTTATYTASPRPATASTASPRPATASTASPRPATASTSSSRPATSNSASPRTGH